MAYQTGHIAESTLPFNALRLVDLWLATGQFSAAEALLRSLQPDYPGALEMLFLHAPPPTTGVVANGFCAAPPQKPVTNWMYGLADSL